MELNTIASLFGFSKTDRVALLIKRIRKREFEAVIEWCDFKKERLYKIGWAHLENQHDLQDAFQNTIIKIYEHIGELREDKFFETWATRIFINECRTILRSKSFCELTDDITDGSNYENDSNLDLLKALKLLNPDYSDPILLKYYCGYSQEEIADILDIPLGTVKSRIYRGLRILKNILKGDDNDGDTR